MLFNSVEFVFLFLPVVWIVYMLLNRTKHRTIPIYWLVLSSLFFYGYFNVNYIYLIFLSVGFNYVFGILLEKVSGGIRKKTYLAIGISANVLLLGYFKYADFFIENVNTVFKADYGLLYLVLPLGLSFITFQMIGYLVDAYNGETKRYGLAYFSLFVTFFPQLIAGPIIKHNDTIPQFEDESKRKINLHNLGAGIFIFMVGMLKKVVIADTVAVWANDGFQNFQALTFSEAWITSLAYTIQLYFDFSGYCDMAIGLGLMFNIRIPVNFYSPYKARNIQEFWKKWHITLGSFLTRYVYIPLGGNRKGNMRTYINLFLVFFISGFWHGAGWTFILWGAMHGIASIVVRLWGKTNIRLPYLLSWFITFQFVNVAWVYFRASSVEQANTIIMKMFSPDWGELAGLFTHPVRSFAESATFDYIFFTLDNSIVVVGTISVLLLFTFIGRNSIEWLESFSFNRKYMYITAGFLFLVLFSVYFMQKNSTFLYFNF